jgi:hypothetical protein
MMNLCLGMIVFQDSELCFEVLKNSESIDRPSGGDINAAEPSGGDFANRPSSVDFNSRPSGVDFNAVPEVFPGQVLPPRPIDGNLQTGIYPSVGLLWFIKKCIAIKIKSETLCSKYEYQQAYVDERWRAIFSK